MLDEHTGYAHQLPPTARQWLEGFLLETYAVEGKRIATGLHADVPRAVRGPARARRWWRGVERLWSGMDAARRGRARTAAARLGLVLQADPSRRRALYVDQNRAARDVYSLGRVKHYEGDDDDS